MKLADWTAAVTAELAAAGFEVSEYQGFPLVKIPKSLAEGVRFLKFKTTLRADRTMYAEGALFTPAGAARIARELEAAAATDAAGEGRSPEREGG